MFLPATDTVLDTARLRLRPLRAADAPAMTRLAGDPEVARRTARIPHPYPPGEAGRFIAARIEDARAGRETAFAICPRERPDELIGVIGLVAGDGDSLEVGYWLGRPYWNRGLMGEALAAVIAHARAGAPAATIRAHTFPDNAASRRVLERAGFVAVGTGTCCAPAREGGAVAGAPLFELAPGAEARR